MGSTTYFQCNVKARELAAVAGLASELPAWKDWSIFERFQRDLAIRRVRTEIVPYLVQTRDRFFGALIVLVYEPDGFEFEPLEQMGMDLPRVYADVANRMGFLTIDGGDLVVLDGQHRLAALREVVTAGDELQGEFRDAIAEDELFVVFIQHESFEKTRRIFNKVNRYAKPTSPSDNIITSEDDGCAVVTRWLVEPQPPLGLTSPQPPLALADGMSEPLVEWRSNKLEAASMKFTTLQHLYQTVQIILEANGIKNFDEKHLVNRPPDGDLIAAYRHSAEWWQVALDNLIPFHEAVRNVWWIPEYRTYHHEWSLLFRPLGQVAMFHGLAGAQRFGIDLEVAVQRCNDVEWRASADHWIDTVIFANGHMNARAQGVRLAGRLITYLIAADKMSEANVSRLRNDLTEAKGLWSSYKLPEPVV